MRYVQFVDDHGDALLGIDRGDGSAEILGPGGPLSLLSAPEHPPTGKIAKINRFLPPLIPVNLYCIGLNYMEHALEQGKTIPDKPVIFMKPTTAVASCGDDIHIPKATDPAGEVDYECELAVIIGRSVRDVSEQDALDAVFGYTAANDVSARIWQRQGGGGQWIRGKSFDTFCPLGPAAVTAHPIGDGDKDFIPDPQALSLKTTLNGEVMQDGHTSDMIFSVATLVACLSRDTTLLPGTVIITGTPSGVGFARNPPVWLKDGDEVKVDVERVGTLENKVIGAG